MDTKLKGDIAEQAAVIEALRRGWGVLRPVGDRLPRCVSDREEPLRARWASFQRLISVAEQAAHHQ